MGDRANVLVRQDNDDPGVYLYTHGQVMARNHVQADALLARHLRGDWGDLTEMAKRNNDAVLSRGGALRSGYLLPDGKSIWIVTSAERNSTIIMLPEDY